MKSLAVVALAMALLAIACAAPEPAVEQVVVTREVEVTRVVDRIVEVEVTRVVDRTVEVEVPAWLTQAATQAAPAVDRTVEVEVPAWVNQAATRVAPAIETSTLPSPTLTPLPANAPDLSVNINDTAALRLHLGSDAVSVQVYAAPNFQVDDFDIERQLRSFLDENLRCSGGHGYSADGWQQIECRIEYGVGHGNLSSTAPEGVLRCSGVRSSLSPTSVIDCTWQKNPQ